MILSEYNYPINRSACDLPHSPPDSPNRDELAMNFAAVHDTMSVCLSRKGRFTIGVCGY